MKKSKLVKAISSLLLTFSVMTLIPVQVHAEWKKEDRGWWYADGSSYYTGWKQIDSKWYYFDLNGYMVSNTIIDGYKLGEDGAWIPNANIATADTAIVPNESDFDFDPNTGTIIKYKGTTNPSIRIPDKIKGVPVKIVGDKAFMNHNELLSIVVSDGITTISNFAFSACQYLYNITLPNSVTTIRFSAFCGDESLMNFVIPNNVTTVEEYVFDGCRNLTTLTVPKSLKLTDEQLVGSYYLSTIKIIRV